MQNMVTLYKGDALYKVFFDTNRETQDFENIRIRDASGEPLLVVNREELDAIKDCIAQEIILATMDLAAEFKAGTVLPC